MKIEVLYPILLFLVAFTLTSPIFEEGFLICKDNPRDLARLEVLTKDLLPNGRLHGWSELNSAGFPVFLYDYQLGNWIVALISKIFDLSTAYKILIFLSYFGPILITFLVVKRLTSANIALIVALLMSFQIDFLASPLEGLWAQYFSLIFLIPVFYLLDLSLSRYQLKNFIVLGLLLAAIILSHQYTAFYTIAIAIFGLLFYGWKRKSQIKKLSLGIILSLGIAASLTSFYLIPLLETSHWLRTAGGDIGGTPFSSTIKVLGHTFLPHMRLDEIKNSFNWNLASFTVKDLINNLLLILNLSFRNISELIFSILAILGIVNCLIEKGEFKKFLLISLIGTFAIISGITVSTPLNALPFLNAINSSRFIIYVRVLLLFFATFGILYLLKLLRSAVHFRNMKPSKEDFYFSIAVLLIIAHFSFSNVNDFVCKNTSGDMPEIDNLNKLWIWIKDNVNGEKTRIIYQDTFSNYKVGNLGFSHILALSKNYTTIPQIGAWTCGDPYFLDISCTGYGRLFNSTVDELNETQLNYWLGILNAKYIVSIEPKLQNKLRNLNSFNEVANFGNFSVFDFITYSPSWILVDGISGNIELLEFKDGSIIFNFNNSKVPSEIVVKTQYHPYWKAYIDSIQTPVESNELGLIKLTLDKAGYTNVKLVYN